MTDQNRKFCQPLPSREPARHPVTPVGWFKRMPTGGTVYLVRGPSARKGGARTT